MFGWFEYSAGYAAKQKLIGTDYRRCARRNRQIAEGPAASKE